MCTVEFWSVDVAGNIETHKTVSFTITAPVTTTDTYTVRVCITTRGTIGRLATLRDATTAIEYTALVGAKGYVVFTSVPAGTYTLSVDTRKGEKTLRTVRVTAPSTDGDDHEDAHYSYLHELLRR